ncbi:MAG: glycosyltransferase family 4 protein [Patescibacteria group bacterium]
MNYWLIFLVGLVMSLTITPIFRWLAYRFGIVDKPDNKRKLHARSVAYLGGLALFVVFLIEMFLFVELTSNILMMIGGLVLVVLIGLIDDIYKLKPWQKFLGHLFIGFLLVIGGIGIQSFPLPNGGYIGLNQWLVEFSIGGILIKFALLSGIFTLLWTVFLINSVNFLDGLDGLAGGISLIAFLIIFSLSLSKYVNQSDIAVISVIMVAALLGFLPYNLPSASIFLGDAGSMMLGYLLAVLSILSGGKVATLVLVLGVVILDTFLVVISRIRSGKKIWSADRLHMHHRLLDRGIKHWQILFGYYGVSLVLGLSAVLVPSSIFKLVIWFIFIIIFFIFSYLLMVTKKVTK